VADVGRWKQPPPGVPTAPDPTRPYVSLAEAAKRRGMDRRTLMRALVKAGQASPLGWVRPGPDNLRWYIYEDAIVSRGEPSSGARADLTAGAEAQQRVAQL
ncbi:hypothetical protein PJM53_29085, partial [Mycobacterium kansasii]